LSYKSGTIINATILIILIMGLIADGIAGDGGLVRVRAFAAVPKGWLSARALPKRVRGQARAIGARL
jgi:hypothetical protein